MTNTMVLESPRRRAEASIRVDARRALDQLFDVEDLLSDAVATSLRQLLFADSEIDPAEAVWVERIEELRGRLERSSARIPVGLPFPSARERYSTVGEICRRRSKRRLWGRLLHKLVRELGPNAALELGTCLGISTAYQGAALERNHRGRLMTLEGASALAAIAESNMRGLGIGRVQVRPGLFRDTLSRALHDLPRLDYVFIDGHHDEHATIEYFDQILPYLAPRAMVVFDDIAWSDGMKRAWSAIASDPRVPIAIDLASIGICLLGPGLPRRRFAFAPLSRIVAAEGAPKVHLAVRGILPSDASVLVVSRGDDQLLALEGARATHFPQSKDGGYAGYHPADSEDAIAHLERLRRQGAGYLLFPSTSFWWLEHYGGLREHLERTGRAVHRDDQCIIYRLGGS